MPMQCKPKNFKKLLKNFEIILQKFFKLLN